MRRRWIWRWMWRWRSALFFVVVLVLAACRGPVAPPPGEQLRPGALVQPVSLEEIYWATPVAAFVPVADELTAEDIEEGEDEVDAETLIQAGAPLYSVNCAPCHGENGAGNLNRFPPLNRNAFVTASSPQPLIRTVLYGRGVMPAFAVTMTDREVAAVLSYIRTAWDNDAGVIHPADVREVEPQPLGTPTVSDTQSE